MRKRESCCKNDLSLRESVAMMGTDDAGHNGAELQVCRIERCFFQD